MIIDIINLLTLSIECLTLRRIRQYTNKQFLSVSVSVSLSLCLSLSLSLSVSLSLSLSVSVCFSLSESLSICLCLSLSVCLSMSLSPSLSIYVTVMSFIIYRSILLFTLPFISSFFSLPRRSPSNQHKLFISSLSELSYRILTIESDIKVSNYFRTGMPLSSMTSQSNK